ncbi:unnamed protein product [Dibothriocephalus latus]|uniref:G-protein coupled receptors family 1 profile domain-containing protein n=1 Tax=Dibothriocephalus latus TaxID=60516 RepID=A0A3P6QQ29_DIBLA|nr:unnamed protein product [Dibothriocephalus latus]
MGESSTFWYCSSSTQWPDVFDILLILFEALGLLLNTAVAILLFMLRGPCKTSLALLRGLVVSCMLACWVNLVEDVAPKVQKTPSYHFNRLLCIFWQSRFLYWIFVVIASQFLFFGVYRYLDMTGADDYKMLSEEYQIPTYSTVITVFSVLITGPQTLSVNLVGDDCNCSNRKINIPFLSLIYAQVYLWIAILIVFDGSVLAYISVRLRRLLRTPAGCKREDKLELLHFYNTGLSECQLSTTTAAAAVCSSGITGSMCITPLFVSYLLFFSYDQLYQFASAVDLTTYVIGTQVQQCGELLIIGHFVLVPIIIVVYIRPLRLGMKKCWRRLIDKT